jgi:hypothetical protein
MAKARKPRVPKKVFVLVEIVAPSHPVDWYIEPIGGYTNESLRNLLPEDRECRGVTCADKVKRNFWKVTFEELQQVDESRKNDNALRYSVWSDTNATGKPKLYKPDTAYGIRLKRGSGYISSARERELLFKRKLKRYKDRYGKSPF